MLRALAQRKRKSPVLVKDTFHPADLIDRVRRLVRRTPDDRNGKEAAS